MHDVCLCVVCVCMCGVCVVCVCMCGVCVVCVCICGVDREQAEGQSRAVPSLGSGPYLCALNN